MFSPDTDPTPPAQPSAPHGDHVTVLHAPNRRLAKLIRADGTVEGYDRARTLDAAEVAVADLDALAALLARLLAHPDCCIIRGAPLAGPRARGIRRLLFADRATGEEPTMRDVPRRWLALDMENITRPEGVAASDLTGCAAAAVATLPHAFHHAHCIVQASASHGIKPDLRLRLWFWLDRPTSGNELKRWLRDTPADPSVFGAVQPIYTAAPVIAPGALDPLPERLAERPGLPLVAVPLPAALALPDPPPRAPLAFRTPDDASAYVRAALVGAAHKIMHAELRHPTILAECRSLGRLVHAGLLPELAFRAVVHRTAAHAGKDDPAEVDSCIAWGLANSSGGGGGAS